MKNFRLSEPEHGWIDVTFGEEPDTFTMSVSRVPNDCLRELAAAVARLLKWGEREVLEFSLEPDFATCEMNREADSVRLALTLPAGAEPAFHAMFPLHALARRVRFELLRIQPRYSSDDGWKCPFPTHEVANLA